MSRFHTLQFNTMSIKERYHLMTSAIVPRPIALVTSYNADATILNAAPFSYFNGVSTDPPLIMLGLAARKENGELVHKDSTQNILQTREFVINICHVEMSDIVTKCSEPLPANVSEVEHFGLQTIPSTHIRVPRLACSPAQIECKLYKEIPLGPANSTLILGEILCLHVQQELWENNQLNTQKLNPLARLSGQYYASLGEQFF
ncbi:MAG: flavin reductase family protein [Sumerlaeia bacterium]